MRLGRPKVALILTANNRRLRLALEPLLQIRVSGHMLGQHLNGDGAIEAGVGGFVDLTHAARAEGGVDLVGAECGARRQRHKFVRFTRSMAFSDRGLARSATDTDDITSRSERPRSSPCKGEALRRRRRRLNRTSSSDGSSSDS